MKTFLLLVLCYGIGSISGSYFLGKLFYNMDIRDSGSGNAGTTNAIRVMGKKLGYLTFAVDMLKGMFVMAIIAPLIDEPIRLLAAVCVVLGHDYPFYLKFKGGKGIATTFGVYSVLQPIVVAASALGGFIAGKATRYVSVGSLSFLSIASLLMLVFYTDSFVNRGAILFLWALGFIRHATNLKRLKEGTENKVGG